ncbi:cation diffusion facilitator family transporter [Thiovibrio sp. JS02]
METAEKTAVLSILTNLGLVAIKATLAVVSGSLAIRADAVHSFSDIISSIIILLGIRMSRRSSPAFPYGLYKLENLVALGSSLLILLAGYEICREVFQGSRRQLEAIPLSVAGIGLTILITWAFSRYELKKGQETGSPSLIADARHIWTDMLSSLVILSSLLGDAIGLAIDRYAALVVVVFIARSAFVIFLDSVRVLLDASLDHPTLNRISGIVLADPRVAAVNAIWGRNAGRYKFVELDLVFNIEDLQKGHNLSQELGNRIKKEIGNVDRILIHYQPRRREHLTLGIPLTRDRRTVSDHFGEAPFFKLLTVLPGSGAVIEERLLTNPFLQEEKGKGIKVAQWLLENRLDVLVARKSQEHKGPAYVFGNAGVEILLTSESGADEALAGARKELHVPVGEENHGASAAAAAKEEE